MVRRQFDLAHDLSPLLHGIRLSQMERREGPLVGKLVRVLDEQPDGAKAPTVARIDLGASAQAGSAVAKATVGKGSVTIEEVRMIKNEDFSF